MKKSLDKKAMLIWRIRGLLIAAVGMFISGGVMVFSYFIGFVCSLFVLTAFLIYALIYVPLLYRSYVYTLGVASLSIKKGVLFKRSITLEKPKIQYAEITQAPDQRLLNTCTINFYTAGSVVILDQLSPDEAEKITRKLG